MFSYFKKKEPMSDKDIEQEKYTTAKQWIPIKNVRDGIVHLKSGEYVKIVEVIPVNFKLKSKAERKLLILNYRSFLKACKYPIQISIQCRKANVEPHINRMKTFLTTEKNENVKKMIRGYINLVHSIGNRGAITRKYFMVIPYVLPVGLKIVDYNDVIKQLNEKALQIKEFMLKCGNEVFEHNENEFAISVLYSYLNKRTSEVQKVGRKLASLTGTFLDYDDTDEEEDDENE